ncbi:MAG: hypothetical protein KGL43_15595 [Burkholderiales bacterium]|nr:hypothetical protein [Burkholderiales bacterium]MDE2397970.1 hypothetical protein [Burkholderiales bacterium]MDE2455015.1 hypothetical protein [Burkholderiales bacterium]
MAASERCLDSESVLADEQILLRRLDARRSRVTGPQSLDGSIARPLGKVGRDLPPEQGYQAAPLTARATLGSLERELGSLDRFGPEIGAHSRSALAMAELPFDIPVEIEGEVEMAG